MEVQICSLLEWVAMSQFYVEKLEYLDARNQVVVDTPVGIIIPPLTKYFLLPLAAQVGWYIPITGREEFNELLITARHLIAQVQKEATF